MEDACAVVGDRAGIHAFFVLLCADKSARSRRRGEHERKRAFLRAAFLGVASYDDMLRRFRAGSKPMGFHICGKGTQGYKDRRRPFGTDVLFGDVRHFADHIRKAGKQT